jgi:hypothetical protein
MNAVTFTIECDLDGDGTWETDLSPYANLGAGGLKISRGMSKSGEYVVSSIEVGLTNQDGRFSPEYSASPLYGLLEPHVPIRVTASHLGRTYTLWSGYVDTWRVSGRGLASVCSVTASDVGKYLVDSEAINLTVSTSRDTDGAIAAVFDQMGLEAADYWLDDGAQDLPYSFAIGQKAMTAAMEFVRSEMGGHLFVLGDGRLLVHAHHLAEHPELRVVSRVPRLPSLMNASASVARFATMPFLAMALFVKTSAPLPFVAG